MPDLLRCGSNAGHFSHRLQRQLVSRPRNTISALTEHHEEHAATGDEEHPHAPCSASIG